MANGHGGRRVPAKPAPVSGPGALSRRTDGQVQADFTGGEYGDSLDMQRIQGAAPMSASAPQAAPAPASVVPPPAAAVPFDAPTQHPDEPLTSGSPFGPGFTPAPSDPNAEARMSVEHLRPYLPTMLWAADQSNASPNFRAYVRWISSLLREG